MFKEIITVDENTTIDLEYDKEKYSMEYVKTKDMIILRRLKDNQILKIFSDKIGFIVQCDIDQQINFLVSEYSDTNQSKFKHYIDDNSSNSLYLKNEFDCNSVSRITNKSYLINESYYNGTCIYNLKEKSKKFNWVYNNTTIQKIFNDNTVLVSERQEAFLTSEINDTLIYGINPETLEITTSIWSELQQRYIQVYTKEKLDNLKEELQKKGQYINTQNKSIDEITIYFEVTKYLNELSNHFNRPKSTYLYSNNKEMEDFVKTLKK